MKKIFFLMVVVFFLFLSLFLTKRKDEEITTIIKDNKNTLIAINYPKTKYTKLNKEVKKYVQKNYRIFKDEYEDFKHLNSKAELNIDYEYHKIASYLVITLYTSMDAHDQDHPYKEIKTFAFHTKKNKFISLFDIPSNKDILLENIEKQLSQKYKIHDTEEILEIEKIKEYPFMIHDDYVSLYIKYYQREFTYLVINIPINLFRLEVKKEEKEVFTYTLKNNIIDPSKKVIALTFDDGPSKYTKDIVALLKKYDINATFFVLGNKVPIYKDTLKELLKNGNEIGNHSYNHKWMIKLDKEHIKNQIEKTNEIIKKELNYTPTNLRPTYGSVNEKIKNQTNLNIVLWNVDTLDWKIKNAKKIAARGLKIKDGDIILMHDAYERTVKALKIMIPKLLEEGYQFVTIEELREVNELRKRS